MIVIGIDTGVKTGFSMWEQESKKIIYFESLPIHRALSLVELKRDEISLVRVEDARKRKYIPKDGNAKAQGAGSVKRDAKIWEDFLTDLEIPFEMVAPQKGSTFKATKKNTSRMDRFHLICPNLPRFTTVSEDHIRDATYLCYGIGKNYTKSFI